MGKGALNSHADGGTHNNLLKAHLKSKSYNLKTMFQLKSGESSKDTSGNGLKPSVILNNSTVKGDRATAETSSEQGTITNYIQSNEMMHMELATVCKTVALNQSFIANDKTGDYFELLLTSYGVRPWLVVRPWIIFFPLKGQ